MHKYDGKYNSEGNVQDGRDEGNPNKELKNFKGREDAVSETQVVWRNNPAHKEIPCIFFNRKKGQYSLGGYHEQQGHMKKSVLAGEKKPAVVMPIPSHRLPGGRVG